MAKNEWKASELYSVVNGVAAMAVARKLQKNFRNKGIGITVEQWSLLYHLWKKDGLTQQELCHKTFKNKPSITRLIDNLEKQQLVKRNSLKEDKRKKIICLTKLGKQLQLPTKHLAEITLNEALKNISIHEINIVKQVLQKVYDNVQCNNNS